MKYLKAFEGVFSFFKLKNDKVKLDDIKDCLLDLTDEDGILNSIYDKNDLIEFTFTPSVVTNRVSLTNTYKNIILVKISYKSDIIDDQLVIDILTDCKEKLKYFNCIVTYFIAINKYGYCPVEFSNFNNIKNKNIRIIPFRNSVKSDRTRKNITIKISY